MEHMICPVFPFEYFSLAQKLLRAPLA